VAAAVGNVGGTVQSSQVDVLGTQAKDGFVGLLVSCEMEQPALQKLLYDLEVGMPPVRRSARRAGAAADRDQRQRRGAHPRRARRLRPVAGQQVDHD